MANFTIALYLGESYASIGVFQSKATKSSKLPKSIFSKSVFLSQVSLKSLIGQAKKSLAEDGIAEFTNVKIFVVTKYLDRLRNFRLGGSVSQVLMKGFENSYTLCNSRNLSLAASQLIISIPENVNEAWLETELARIKKINPDLNKVVVALPETHITADKMALVLDFFEKNELKIFKCPSAFNQSELRKTLLNAGTEGVKEEIISDLKEAFSQESEVFFFVSGKFRTQFENCDLFHSLNSFLATFLNRNGATHGAFFDIDGMTYVKNQTLNHWQSPWGEIPVDHPQASSLPLQPFAEVKLNRFSRLEIDSQNKLLEPGPMMAGRGIKPLVMDLFFEELKELDLVQEIFPSSSQDNTKSKISNTFNVLEKSHDVFDSEDDFNIEAFKETLTKSVEAELQFNDLSNQGYAFGPLAEAFAPHCKSLEFSMLEEILRIGIVTAAEGKSIE